MNGTSKKKWSKIKAFIVSGRIAFDTFTTHKMHSFVMKHVIHFHPSFSMFHPLSFLFSISPTPPLTPQTHSPVLSKPRLHFQPIRRHLCHRYAPHKGAQTGKHHYSSLSTGSWQAQSSPPSKDPDPAHQGTCRPTPSAAHQIPASAQPILPLTLPFSAPFTYTPFLLPFVLCP